MREISRLTLISLGSNENSTWGDARETIQKAMSAVAQMSDNTTKFSRLFATPAFPAGTGPEFVNAGMAIFTKLSAVELLAQLHQIEALAGRTRAKRWGQRTLDIDLIAMGSEVLPDAVEQTRWRTLSLDDQTQMTPAELILPHPRLQDRAFVLVPLNEVAPDWVHPLLDQSITQMCAALPAVLQSEVVALDEKQRP